tara:strand:- start:289 stop:573 length:285 start_codon:yes stop_codon:yes gene_type:complete
MFKINFFILADYIMPHKPGHKLTPAQKKAGMKLIKKASQSKPVRKARRKVVRRVNRALPKPVRTVARQAARNKAVRRAAKKGVKKAVRGLKKLF